MAGKKEKTININREKADKLGSTASYISLPKGTTLQISGAERKWKGTDKVAADPTFTYAFMNRVAGQYNYLRTLQDIDLVNVFTFENTREGQPMRAAYLREIEIRDNVAKKDDTPRITLTDIPGLLAASEDKTNWVNKRDITTGKGKGAGKGKGGSRGPTKSLKTRFGELRDNHWIVVTDITAQGVGAGDKIRAKKPQLGFVDPLPMASMDARGYNIALDLLAEEGVTEWGGYPLSYYRDNFGRSQGATTTVSTVTRSPLVGAVSPGRSGGSRSPVSASGVAVHTSPFSGSDSGISSRKTVF